ncbi:hypothetical protein GJA_3489 [Janthinobacterium agaricidamnosum NBRC 102515 = DSM 9628]|uniref:Uncharacterized protein n=1 Tax=Janthinobacterium agaricidamnosum NBRC 102515 = DSM 9628 TaxID=1349767 RepID=W0V941_9BURK|nr:hypothetical protein GJA_3489 [Janthinobacterium agaricidamnosum NBRC 102515 = DSM 9628]
MSSSFYGNISNLPKCWARTGMPHDKNINLITLVPLLHFSPKVASRILYLETL